MRCLGVLSVLLCGVPAFEAAAHTATPGLSIPPGYQLVWSDEFETDGAPDSDKWSYDTFWNAKGWWNKEQQYYTDARPKNARVKDGNLIIEAHYEPVPKSEFPDTGGQEFTSARLYTRKKASWLYGYMEIRAKLPCGNGLWPAIWTMPEGDHDWPDDGEIDIMEYYGHQPTSFHATVHTLDRNHVNGRSVGSVHKTPTACGGFHTHSLHWTEDSITMSVDGTEYHRVMREGDDPAVWPFTRAHHLILNVAIRNWAGGDNGIDLDAFPARMEVDYVRIYQKPDAS
ncbi:MAG: glycoside hydrolase family 16 protein [Pseudomonadota bacterium]